MKLSKKYLVIVGGAVLIILISGASIRAEEESAGPHREIEKKQFLQEHVPGHKKSKEMLETIRTVRIIEALKLNEEQIAKVLPAQREMREAKKEFRQSRKERIEELEKLLKSKASSQNLERALESLKAQEKAFRERTEKLQGKIENPLTPEQKARLIIFERQFRKEMRQMLKKHPKGKSPLKKRRGKEEKVRK